MGKPPSKKDSMEEVKALAMAKAKGRSPLYAYMRKNFAGFQEMLDDMRRPDWVAISEALAEATDVRDASGKHPTPTTVRQTWYKVKADRSRTVAVKPRVDTRSATKDGVVEIVRAPAKPEPPADEDDLDARLAKAAESMAFPWDPKPKPKRRTD